MKKAKTTTADTENSLLGLLQAVRRAVSAHIRYSAWDIQTGQKEKRRWCDSGTASLFQESERFRIKGDPKRVVRKDQPVFPRHEAGCDSDTYFLLWTGKDHQRTEYYSGRRLKLFEW